MTTDESHPPLMQWTRLASGSAHDLGVIKTEPSDSYFAGPSNSGQILNHERHQKRKCPMTVFQVLFAFMIGTRTARLLSDLQHPVGPKQASRDRPLQVVNSFFGRSCHGKADPFNFVEDLFAVSLARHKESGTQSTAMQLLEHSFEPSLPEGYLSGYLHENEQLFRLVSILAPGCGHPSDSCRLLARRVGFRPQSPNCYRRRGSDSDADPSDQQGGQGHTCSAKCANRPPRFPPNLAPINPQLPARADAVNPAHSLIPPWTDRHSATGRDTSAERATLATVKPPRDLHTRLRPDTEQKDCSHG